MAKAELLKADKKQIPRELKPARHNTYTKIIHRQPSVSFPLHLNLYPLGSVAARCCQITTPLARRLVREYNDASFKTGETIFLACPFFFPEHRLEDGRWLHPARLPLGNGWTGRCYAPGYEGHLPSDEELHRFCNLGYAAGCPRLPKERSSDAVRFSVARDCGERVVLLFVFESAHLPAGHGSLEYDCVENKWISTHPEPRIQQMAQCYLDSYLLRRSGFARNVSSANND